MRVSAGLLTARNIVRQINPARVTWVATTTPKKQSSDDIGEGGQKIATENADPIVAFSKPPPLPPALGPLVALSLLETWSTWDSNDD